MEAAYVKKATEDLQSHTKRFQHYYDRYNNHLHSLDVSGGAGNTSKQFLIIISKFSFLNRFCQNFECPQLKFGRSKFKRKDEFLSGFWKKIFSPCQIEMKMLQESTGKMRELERLGLALDKKGTVFVCLYYAPINAKPPLPGQGGLCQL